jgi:hypothetical protein
VVLEVGSLEADLVRGINLGERVHQIGTTINTNTGAITDADTTDVAITNNTHNADKRK